MKKVKKKKRLQFDLFNTELKQLDKIVIDNDMRTRSSVIRNAIKLYGFITSYIRQGYEIKLISPDKKEKIILPFK
jgi:hypothetical protein